jgi:hypothetical protein
MGPAHARPRIPRRLPAMALQIFSENGIFVIKNRKSQAIVAQLI